MSTYDLLNQGGIWPVVVVLLLSLAVLTLRLLSLPLAALSLALDRLAVLAARSLPVPTGVTWEAPR